MNALALIGLGFLLGVRHATDPDHVVAVAALTAQTRRLWPATRLGMVWGLGHSLTVSLLLQTVLLWILANAARTHASFVRPMIAAFVVAVAVTGVIAWRYILPVPAFFSLALCATLVMAFISAQSSPAVSVVGNPE